MAMIKRQDNLKECLYNCTFRYEKRFYICWNICFCS